MLIFLLFIKKRGKTQSKPRDDVSSETAVWMSSTIYCVMREALLRVGGSQMSENPEQKLLGTKVGKDIYKKMLNSSKKKT